MTPLSNEQVLVNKFNKAIEIVNQLASELTQARINVRANITLEREQHTVKHKVNFMNTKIYIISAIRKNDEEFTIKR